MDKIEFSTNQLPEDLDDRKRFKLWHDLYSSTFCELDVGRLQDQSFEAHLRFTQYGAVNYSRFQGGVTRLLRTPTNIATDPRQDFCFVLVKDAPLVLDHCGKEHVHAAGSMTMTYQTECMTAEMPDGSSFDMLHVPRELLLSRVGNAEDLAGAVIHETAASRLLKKYAGLVFDTDVENDSVLRERIGAHLLDLVVLTLGANGESAEAARARGLRAARLNEIVTDISRNFSDPNISPDSVAHRLGISARYIHDLLQETGVTLSERVLELRLQRARTMLADPRHDRLKVSDIALACGFNEISYFNRRFRARFGASPTQFRGSSG
jgi:AraC-like DNA-binding protein